MIQLIYQEKLYVINQMFYFLKIRMIKIHLFNAKLLPTEFKSQQHHMLDKY